jgi:hypothetical protein
MKLQDENVQRLINMQQQLEQARYREFWEFYETYDQNREQNREITSEAVGFENAIRKGKSRPGTYVRISLRSKEYIMDRHGHYRLCVHIRCFQ